MRIQSKVKGGRRPISAGVLKEIRRRVERDAASHNCSKAWVVNTILGYYYKVKVERFDSYE